MMQVIEQTREEQVAMYMKLTRKELAGMLVESNRLIAERSEMVITFPYDRRLGDWIYPTERYYQPIGTVTMTTDTWWGTPQTAGYAQHPSP